MSVALGIAAGLLKRRKQFLEVVFAEHQAAASAYVASVYFVGAAVIFCGVLF